VIATLALKRGPKEMELLEIFTQWDESQKAILVASLSGLSLTASSFLFSIKSNLAQKAASLKTTLESINDEQGKKYIRKEIASVESDISEILKAIKRLVNAFYFFIVCLIYSLGVDPIIDIDLINRKLPSTESAAIEAGALLPWLAADVAAYSVLLLGGIVSLIRAGHAIKSMASKS